MAYRGLSSSRSMSRSRSKSTDKATVERLEEASKRQQQQALQNVARQEQAAARSALTNWVREESVKKHAFAEDLKLATRSFSKRSHHRSVSPNTTIANKERIKQDDEARRKTIVANLVHKEHQTELAKQYKKKHSEDAKKLQFLSSERRSQKVVDRITAIRKHESELHRAMHDVLCEEERMQSERQKVEERKALGMRVLEREKELLESRKRKRAEEAAWRKEQEEIKKASVALQKVAKKLRSKSIELPASQIKRTASPLRSPMASIRTNSYHRLMGSRADCIETMKLAPKFSTHSSSASPPPNPGRFSAVKIEHTKLELMKAASPSLRHGRSRSRSVTAVPFR
eukprot:TRINITY_DN16301_c0_g1_i1.p1 TRINITY_DN16301_c0_g1~~TRINITY_DN16301_c0_g1_i1.p1  ORF type:complete len:362 (+),score=63.93 TRINITY_DN16301_c0_g1_i1:59-1087(+)